ncbi:hypothetical protein QBD00_002567 [Ochrobactrum sp. AN78]|nr:hypothetical protein [Ochrobactrum sp. AN78]
MGILAFMLHPCRVSCGRYRLSPPPQQALSRHHHAEKDVRIRPLSRRLSNAPYALERLLEAVLIPRQFSDLCTRMRTSVSGNAFRCISLQGPIRSFRLSSRYRSTHQRLPMPDEARAGECCEALRRSQLHSGKPNREQSPHCRRHPFCQYPGEGRRVSIPSGYL